MYTYTQFIMLQQQKFLTISDQILGLFRIIKSEITGGKKNQLLLQISCLITFPWQKANTPNM